METRDPLQQAIDRWREAEAGSLREGRLSAGARAAILARTRDRSGPRWLPLGGWLFFPGARYAMAGVLPVAVLTLSIGYLAVVTKEGRLPPSAPAPGEPASPVAAGIEAKKDGESVVFVIANGSRVHRVYASESPQRFDEQPAFTTRDGAFEDRLDRGGTLVFYRIE